MTPHCTESSALRPKAHVRITNKNATVPVATVNLATTCAHCARGEAKLFSNSIIFIGIFRSSLQALRLGFRSFMGRTITVDPAQTRAFTSSLLSMHGITVSSICSPQKSMGTLIQSPHIFSEHIIYAKEHSRRRSALVSMDWVDLAVEADVGDWGWAELEDEGDD